MFTGRRRRAAIPLIAKFRKVDIFIEEKKVNRKDKLRSRYPPVYRVKVQKTIGKNVAVST